MRRSITRGLILDVPGENNAEKANNLATRLREIFEENEDVKISRPYKKTEIRVSGLDNSYPG